MFRRLSFGCLRIARGMERSRQLRRALPLHTRRWGSGRHALPQAAARHRHRLTLAARSVSIG
jgi:hypothetical protein